MPLRFWRVLLSYAREVYQTVKRRGLLNGIASNLFAVIFGCVSLLVAFQLMNGKDLPVGLPNAGTRSANYRKNSNKKQVLGKSPKLRSAVTLAFFATDASLCSTNLGKPWAFPDLATIFPCLRCGHGCVSDHRGSTVCESLSVPKTPKAKFKSSNVRVTRFRFSAMCVLLSLMAVYFLIRRTVIAREFEQGLENNKAIALHRT